MSQKRRCWRLKHGRTESAHRRYRAEVLRLVAEDHAQLVEVLPQAEYDEAHLEHALHLPLKQLDAQRAAGLDRDRPVIVY